MTLGLHARRAAGSADPSDATQHAVRKDAEATLQRAGVDYEVVAVGVLRGGATEKRAA